MTTKRKKRRSNPTDWEPIGVIGDVDPIEHWGGIVYKTPHGHEMLYFQETEGTVYVHRVDVADDVLSDLDWVEWDQVASYVATPVAEIKKAARGSSRLGRAQVYEAVAGYYGWSNFDDSPEVLTLDAAEEKYGEDVDRAHRSRNPPTKKKGRGRSRKRNVDEGHPEYHRRNLVMDTETLRELEPWSGSQASSTYSLLSVGVAGEYVSPSMIDAAVSDLEYDQGRTKDKKARKELDDLIAELDAYARYSQEHTTQEAGLGDIDSGYATWLMEEEAVGNPKTKRKGAACKKGELKVKRKGYTRKAYTKKDGTRVPASKVPASTFCIEDRGKPGRGPDIVPELREGKLGGPGYTKKSAAARHRLLAKCVKKYDYQSCLGSLQYLLVVGKDEWPKSKLAKVEADKNWLEKKYGGPGSFGPRKNPERMSKRQFESYFRDEVLPLVAERHEGDGIPDKPARRQAWNDTVDFMMRAGSLPQSAGDWSHPRWLETAKVSNPKGAKKHRTKNTHDVDKSTRRFEAAVDAADRHLLSAVEDLEKRRVAASIRNLNLASYWTGQARAEHGYAGRVDKDPNMRLKRLEKGLRNWGNDFEKWMKESTAA